MSFTTRDGLVVKKCHRCGRWYGRRRGSRGTMEFSCTVAHAPGDCCHYGSTELTEESVAAMFTVYHEQTTGRGHWPRIQLLPERNE